MWTCVAVTCCDSRWAKALRQELDILHRQKLLNSELPCLVLEDPPGTVGSGGATLNALLVTAERLCSINGHSTVYKEFKSLLLNVSNLFDLFL